MSQNLSDAEMEQAFEAQLVRADEALETFNYRDAESIALDVLETANADHSFNARYEASAHRILGMASIKQGRFTTAFEHFTHAMHRFEDLGDKLNAAVMLNNIGNVHSALGESDKAYDYYQKALLIDEEIGNRIGVSSRLGNIGNVHSSRAEYSQAIEYYNRALSISQELGDEQATAMHTCNLGLAYGQLSQYATALQCFSTSLSLYEQLGEQSRVAMLMGNIGNVYQQVSESALAIEYHLKALSIDEELGNKAGIAVHTGNIGNIHVALEDYSTALDYYNTALAIEEELGNRYGVANLLGNIGLAYWHLNDFSKALDFFQQALNIAREIKSKALIATHLVKVGTVYERLELYDQARECFEQGYAMENELGRRAQAVEIIGMLGELFSNPRYADHDEALAEKYLLESIAVSTELGTKKLDVRKVLSDLYKRQEKWQEHSRYLAEYYEMKDEVNSEEARKSALHADQQRQIAERERELNLARTVAEVKLLATTSLLHKVLPESVASRMINGEEEIADYFTSVSILFADIAGFTPISADMPAIVVVRFLNYVFGEFDRIIKKHGCEKIKTIGDGYMAVCGAPVTCDDHAERLAAAALEMQQTISLPESIAEFMPSGVEFGIRIGLHTGSVVAGVIGEERFVYDIYSDAVNTAARMESHGEENRIHCSNDFYRHLQNRFAMTKNTNHGFVFAKRGEMEIKGKGLMRTYFLEKA